MRRRTDMVVGRGLRIVFVLVATTVALGTVYSVLRYRDHDSSDESVSAGERSGNSSRPRAEIAAVPVGDIVREVETHSLAAFAARVAFGSEPPTIEEIETFLREEPSVSRDELTCELIRQITEDLRATSTPRLRNFVLLSDTIRAHNLPSGRCLERARGYLREEARSPAHTTLQLSIQDWLAKHAARALHNDGGIPDLEKLLRDLLVTKSPAHRDDVLAAARGWLVDGRNRQVQSAIRAMVLYGDSDAALLDLSTLCDDIGKERGSTARSAVLEAVGNAINLLMSASIGEGAAGLTDTKWEECKGALEYPRSDPTVLAITAIALGSLRGEPTAILRLTELTRSQDSKVAALAAVNLGRAASPTEFLDRLGEDFMHPPVTPEQAHYVSHALTGLYNAVALNPEDGWQSVPVFEDVVANWAGSEMLDQIRVSTLYRLLELPDILREMRPTLELVCQGDPSEEVLKLAQKALARAKK